MVFVILALAVVCLVGIRFRKSDEENDYLGKKTTASVCGVFVVIVFFHHFCRHIDFSPWYDHIAVSFDDTFLGQLMVVPFLFYGAFGISEQFKRRRGSYLKNFPIQRLLKVYLMYLICLLVEYFANWAMGGFAPIAFDPLSLTMWNTYWFIFVITVEYVLIWLCFLLCKEKRLVVSILITALSIGLALILYYSGKESYWYNTIIAFPFGVIYSLYLKEINGLLEKKRSIPWIAFGVSLLVWLGLFVIDYKVLAFNGLLFFMYYIEVLAFMTTILMFTYLFRFGNKALVILHGYTLWSYLLQNISFALFAGPANVASINKYLYFLCCIAFTGIICVALKFVFDFGWKHTLAKVRFVESRETNGEAKS